MQRLLVTRSRDANLTFAADCLLRVQNQVKKDLPQLIGASTNARQRWIKMRRELNTLLLHLLFQQHKRLFEQLVDFDPINFAGPARETKHLANDVRNAFRFLARDLQEA